MELDAAEQVHQKNNSRAIKGKCYNCGREGHRAVDCRSKAPAKLTNTEETIIVREELSSITSTKEQLLRFNGTINGCQAWILLDSGASRNFISTEFVNQNCLTTAEIKSFKVKFADGSKSDVNKVVNIQESQIDDYQTS